MTDKQKYNFVGDMLRGLLSEENKTIQDLGAQTWMHPGRWSQIINGSLRLSVDMAIRLGKVFGAVECGNISDSVYISPHSSWLHLQFYSDLQNAQVQDGVMYRDMKPFEKEEIAPIEEVPTE